MRILQAYINRVAYELTTIIIPLVPLTYLAHILGPNGVGIIAWSLTSVELFVMLFLHPLSLLGQLTLSNQRQDLPAQIQTFGNILFLRLIMTLITVGLFFWYYQSSAGWFIRDYAHELQLASGLIIAGFLDISWLYQGTGRRTNVVLQSSFSKIFLFLFVLLFVKTSTDIDAYIILVVIIQILTNLLMWFRIPNAFWQKIRLRPQRYLRHWVPMMLSVAGLQLFYVIGRLLLPLYPLDFELWVGYLDSAIKLLSVGTVIVISIGLNTLPKFFHLANHGKFDDMLNHMNNVLENVTAFGMALMFGTLGMASGLTQWFLGVEYLRVGQLMMALSPVLVLVGWSTVLGGQYLRVAGKNTLVTLSMLAGLATMLAFGVLLVRNHAGFGAVVAIDLAQLVIVIMQAFFARQVLSWHLFFKISWQYLLAGAVMWLAVFIIGYRQIPAPFISFMQLVIGTIVYVGIIWALRSPLINDAKQILREYSRFYRRNGFLK